MIGTTEIILVIAVLVLFFGASKIPELARGVGEGISEFRNASKEHLEGDTNENSAETTSGQNQGANEREEVKQAS